jgi:hypothetical protein
MTEETCRYSGRTAYAIRSPLESVDSGVGWPRAVVGEAAQVASVGGLLDCCLFYSRY